MILDIGNLQVGDAADTSALALNGSILIPPGGILPTGYPVARNLLAAQGNYLGQFAGIPGLGSFQNGDQQTSLPLSGVQAATTGAAGVGGVYAGQPVTNPWLNTPANTLNVTPLDAPAVIARTGLKLAFVGAQSSGTAVKVGDFVGKGATLGTTSLYPYLISSGGTTRVAGNTYGQVVATPIWTTLSTAVAAAAAQVAGVWNTNGIATTGTLIINPGGANQETVSPTAVSAAAPGVSTLTIVGTAGSASVVQLTFNVSGYQGSAGLTGPTGTLTTTFTLLVNIPSGTTVTATATLVLNALLASGFVFGSPANLLGIGSGTFSQVTGAPASGALIYVANPSSGVLLFSAAQPGIWANTLMTYTVTVIGGTTQTFNTAVAGSATAVAFASGAAGTFTATFANAHLAGEPVIGINNASQSTLVPVPGTAGQQNVGLAYVDLN